MKEQKDYLNKLLTVLRRELKKKKKEKLNFLLAMRILI